MKAASPCTSSGKTFRRCSVSPRIRCRARAFHSTTGSTASKGKPFLTHVAGVQGGLERFGFEQRAQERYLNLARCRMLLGPPLQPHPHPLANARVLDMHEFRADGFGINSLETGDHFAQGHWPIVEEKFRRNAKIKI